jgi:hypothetical protein
MNEKLLLRARIISHLCVGEHGTRVYLSIDLGTLFMSVIISNGDIFFETQVNCLECQYLHRPNPDEDHYLCLRTLEEIFHELDEYMTCFGYAVIETHWKPILVEECQNYI